MCKLKFQLYFLSTLHWVLHHKLHESVWSGKTSKWKLTGEHMHTETDSSRWLYSSTGNTPTDWTKERDVVWCGRVGAPLFLYVFMLICLKNVMQCVIALFLLVIILYPILTMKGQNSYLTSGYAIDSYEICKRERKKWKTHELRGKLRNN